MPSGRTQVLHDEVSLAVGTLGSLAAIKADTNVDAATQQGAKIEKVRAFMEFEGKTSGQGPIGVGFCRGLDATEIAEAMIADPQHMGDAGKSEQANRAVYPIWVIYKDSSGGLPSSTNLFNIWMRGIPIPSWHVIESNAFSLFAFNRGSALTTGLIIGVQLSMVIRWLDD